MLKSELHTYKCIGFLFGYFAFSAMTLFLAERIIKADCPKYGKAATNKFYIMLWWAAY